MSEQIISPSPENNPENKLSRGQVVEILREKGFENLEAHAALCAWIEDREKKVATENTSKSTIECEIDKALLYAEAGYFAEALEELEKTREAAFNEISESPESAELYQRIMSEMETIEKNKKVKNEGNHV